MGCRAEKLPIFTSLNVTKNSKKTGEKCCVKYKNSKKSEKLVEKKVTGVLEMTQFRDVREMSQMKYSVTSLNVTIFWKKRTKTATEQ